MRMRRLAIPILLVAAVPALAVPPAAPDVASLRAVQGFINDAAPVCAAKPAARCVDVAWDFAAAAPQRGLSQTDVTALRQRVGAWFEGSRERLPPRDRGLIGLAILLADGIGVPQLHAAFDSNGDGHVSRAELLADVTLDDRPLGDVLSDPAAVDRAGLARRVGLPPEMVRSFFR